MKRFVVIATATRGVVSPREELDDAGQYKANLQAELDEAEDQASWRRPALRALRLERDSPVRRGEDWPARKPPTAVELARERIRRTR